MIADEKKLELMKKLQALAERGIGGEKDTAQKKLQQLAKKYSITEEELMEDKLEDYDFQYHSEFERKILRQVMYKIAKERQIYTYRGGRGSKSTLGITCTKAEEIQIRIEYEFYTEVWKEDVEFFMSAFIQKHRIFPERQAADGDNDDDGMTKEEIMRMWSMMQGMKDKTMQPLLGEMEDDA